MKRELGVSTVYVARSVVQHVGKDPRNFFSLHGIIRRCLWAERSGVPARLPGGWPKVPPERTVSSVSGGRRWPYLLSPSSIFGLLFLAPHPHTLEIVG